MPDQISRAKTLLGETIRRPSGAHRSFCGEGYSHPYPAIPKNWFPPQPVYVVRGGSLKGSYHCDDFVAERIEYFLSVTLHDENGAFKLSLSGLPGHRYWIESSPNLLDWTMRLAPQTNAAGFLEWQDDFSLDQPSQFYRLKW